MSRWPFSASVSSHDAIGQGAIYGTIFGGCFPPTGSTDKRRKYRKSAAARSLGLT